MLGECEVMSNKVLCGGLLGCRGRRTPGTSSSGLGGLLHAHFAVLLVISIVSVVLPPQLDLPGLLHLRDHLHQGVLSK